MGKISSFNNFSAVREVRYITLPINCAPFRLRFIFLQARRLTTAKGTTDTLLHYLLQPTS